ncbi:MAG TPA: hypothetical protein QF480_04420 [Bacteroidales bacterium]|jgi:uridine kinase|nr:hypothetical protein [Bacteroidota bacterium]HJN05836.1 hypothetical protein [Bacteroidales bacterium]|tara:strand:- start:243 stop:752 length:510 start_codon:yes stop_codon:yes gene_type:complete
MVIGIGGISNAGKSTLALRINDYYSSNKVIILCQDDYAFPKDKIPLIRDHVNWECPESIDFNYYENVVQEVITKNEIVIVEGIFAFYKDSFNKHIDRKIFLTLDRSFFFSRKSNDLRWGKEPEWYMQHIWDSHHKYCDHNTPKDALRIKANEDIDLKMVIDFLEKSNVK